MADDIEAKIDISDFDRVLKDFKEFNPKLQKQMLKRLRAAGNIAVQASKQAIEEMPTKGVKHRAGTASLRRGVAQGLSAQTPTRKGEFLGVKVTSRSAFLPENKRPVLKALNRKGERFRHPVFAGAVRSRGGKLTSKGAFGQSFGMSTKTDAKGKRTASGNWAWVDQPTWRYFRDAAEKHEKDIRAEIRAALDEAIRLMDN